MFEQIEIEEIQDYNDIPINFEAEDDCDDIPL